MSTGAPWPHPATTRSRVVLEIASELVAQPDHRARQAKVLLRERGDQAWSLSLFGSSTFEGVHEVVDGTSHLAIINPSVALTLAYRGVSPFAEPQPVRLVGVIPSHDRMLFAVRPETGLVTFGDIVARRLPLRVVTRGTPGHCIHQILDHVAEAAGFSFGDIKAWGGSLLREGGVPSPGDAKFQAVASGTIDAIFDEGADAWLDAAVSAGMKILPLGDKVLRKLDVMGYRRAVVSHPKLPPGIETIDFSGWPIFVRADLDDSLVTRVCAALEARSHSIPWQGKGALPIERMCFDGADTPMDVPLHCAAERYWRARGFLR